MNGQTSNRVMGGKEKNTAALAFFKGGWVGGGVGGGGGGGGGVGGKGERTALSVSPK